MCWYVNVDDRSAVEIEEVQAPSGESRKYVCVWLSQRDKTDALVGMYRGVYSRDHDACGWSE